MEINQRRLLSRWGEYLPIVLLVASLALNIYQQRRIEGASASARVILKAGDRFPELDALDLGGARAHLEWNSGKVQTVLYVFRPTCIWCARNIDNIRTLASVKNQSYRFIGISLTNDGLAEYQKKANLPFPVYSIDLGAARRAKLGPTPEMIVVDGNGKIRRDFTGALQSKQQIDAENLFDLRLPGLVSEAGS